LEEAVKKLQNFKISGYVQAQYQYGEPDAVLKVGTKNDNADKGFHRIGIRRGRIKLMYDGRFATGTFQLDLTEKGINLKDAYFAIKDPWFHSGCLIKAGVFYRPFGYEISYSSSMRESPERTMLCQMLFPDERDLGLMLTLQAPATSTWSIVKLEAGIFAGNGIKLETDSRTDFIGHLSVNKEFKNNIKLGGGFSYYYGSVYQGTEKVYVIREKKFVLSEEDANKGKFAKREYMGFDLQFSVMSAAGMSQLRAEYLFGQQPGSPADSKSPNASILPSFDTYIRPFSGAYLIFTQDFGHVPLSAVLKYDWFDPNRKIADSNIGEQLYSGAGDIAYHTFGFGLLWHATPSIRVQAYYDLIFNERSPNLADYNKDKKDNVFTLRLQYKF
jgi:phosphate-selective porin